jgi:hypothetical protein
MGINRSWTAAAVTACMVVSCLLAVPGCGQAEEGLKIESIELTIEADPENELLDVEAYLHLRRDRSIERHSFRFLKPSEITRVYEVGSDRELPYEIDPDPKAGQGVYHLSVDLSDCDEDLVVGLAYQYDRDSFYAEDLNPSTGESLVLGQITKNSIYSSHLDYYPFSDGLAKKASIRIIAPQGWVGVSSGNLTRQEDLQDGSALYEYEIPFTSGRLPYPLAIFPYKTNETLYEDRLPVTIYSSEEDVLYAEERLALVTGMILPFLEDLMGAFPFNNLRIVEVFPREGMTGLAVKSLVMLSKEMLFGVPIEGDYGQFTATVLVDEIAHQWNFYKVMLPNYLAEGISQYTTDMFVERYVNPDIMRENVESYREYYTTITDFLNTLKLYKDEGMNIEEVSRQLNVSVDEIEPYWPFADYGEVPITDPNVYLSLYFVKGALAIDALRKKLGDEEFFAGFRHLFSKSSQEEVTLDYYRECFESEHGGSLEDFFERWYLETGLPSE